MYINVIYMYTNVFVNIILFNSHNIHIYITTVSYIYQLTISSPAMMSYTNECFGSVIVVICVVVFPFLYISHGDSYTIQPSMVS